MNVYLREMKANRKSLIFWSIGILLMIASGMGKFSAIGSSDMSVNSIMATLPKSIRAIFGVGDFDLSKASGFYGLLFLYLVLMAGIHAGLLGANIIAKEEREKTTEFLYVKPASRFYIVSAKLLAALTNLVIFNLITLILSIVVVSKYSKGESVNKDIVLLMIAMFIIQLMFVSIGACFAAVGHNPKRSGSYVMGILMFMYLISVIVDLNDKFEMLKYFTVFKYFDASKIMRSGGLNLGFTLISLVITGVCGYFTYSRFKERDLGI